MESLLLGVGVMVLIVVVGFGMMREARSPLGRLPRRLAPRGTKPEHRGLQEAMLEGRAFRGTMQERSGPLPRALGSFASVSIAEVEEGAVAQVSGRLAYDGKPLEAPLSKRECACWSVLVEERPELDASSAESSEGRVVIEAQGSVPFLVRDDTGAAVVLAEEPKLLLVRELLLTPLSFDVPFSRFVAFVESHGQVIRGAGGRYRNLRYREAIVGTGDEVAVLGHASLEPGASLGPGPGGGYRSAPKRLTISGSRGVPLFVSDDPRLVRGRSGGRTRSRPPE